MVDSYKHKGQRLALVEKIKEKGITDEKVLEAIGKIPRHFFMDSAFEAHAYQDKPFSIGEGQTISQPYTVALQTELLEVNEGDKVLEVGTGSGYQAAVLMEVGAEVYTIEYNRILHNRSRHLLQSMAYQGRFFFGDGSKGLPSFAPYDKIIVTAGAPSLPKELIKQLKVGGILVIPVGDDRVQHMTRITKIDEKTIQKEDFGMCSFVKLRGEYGWKG
ncbi:protein-L-isoaspartate(D-aspartate) O-methyltransferase [Limibacter armeniacum]|uniref:protein-L-isoaspartate(D-aspartate) O-methyltransferase n=1 Tax=Limibacter armeniacum TaxID=466084 RepID=UPI002FE660B7